jgi:hypothetical protein
MPAVAAPPGTQPAPKAARGTDEWYETHRRPAPYPVRLVVWLLCFVLVLVLAGRAVEHYHPSWLDFARNSAQPSAASTTQGTSGKPATSSTHPSTGFQETSHSTTGASYSVPASSYTIVLTTSKSYPCWIVINTPAGSSHSQYAQTVAPSQSPQSFAVSGSSKVTISATAASISVETGGKPVGTITAPKLGPYTYTFVPAGS